MTAPCTRVHNVNTAPRYQKVRVDTACLETEVDLCTGRIDRGGSSPGNFSVGEEPILLGPDA